MDKLSPEEELKFHLQNLFKEIYGRWENTSLNKIFEVRKIEDINKEDYINLDSLDKEK